LVHTQLYVGLIDSEKCLAMNFLLYLFSIVEFF